MKTWYSSKELRKILHISPQYLYTLKKSGRVKTKEISQGKYLYTLPEGFNVEAEIESEKQLEVLEILQNAIKENKKINLKIEILN